MVEAQELSWLASALFNVGVDLHGGQQYAAAASAMRAAVAAAAVGLRALAEAGNTDQVRPARMAVDPCCTWPAMQAKPVAPY